MSPEQVGGERIDGRSDLYAVGLLLFESIAGKGPFDDARDANEMLVAHLGKVPPRLGAMAQGVTRELDALVASLLAKAPARSPAHGTSRCGSARRRSRALRRRLEPRRPDAAHELLDDHARHPPAEWKRKRRSARARTA